MGKLINFAILTLVLPLKTVQAENFSTPAEAVARAEALLRQVNNSHFDQPLEETLTLRRNALKEVEAGISRFIQLGPSTKEGADLLRAGELLAWEGFVPAEKVAWQALADVVRDKAATRDNFRDGFVAWRNICRKNAGPWGITSQTLQEDFEIWDKAFESHWPVDITETPTKNSRFVEDLMTRGLREGMPFETAIEVTRSMAPEDRVFLYAETLRAIRTSPEGLKRDHIAYLEKSLDKAIRDTFKEGGETISWKTRMKLHPDSLVNQSLRGVDQVSRYATALGKRVTATGQAAYETGSALTKICGLVTASFRSRSQKTKVSSD